MHVFFYNNVDMSYIVGMSYEVFFFFLHIKDVILCYADLDIMYLNIKTNNSFRHSIKEC